MGDYVDDILARLRRRRRGVEEQDPFSIRDRSPVLHGAGREVLERDVIELLQRIGHSIVFVQVVEDPDRFLQTPAAMGDPVGKGPHADFRSLPTLPVEGFERPDDEGEEVGGHARGFGEADKPGAVSEIFLLRDRSV